ncbi:pseudaminic acid biosynthesis-associated methylase [Polynucleobacter paneuropaeus]|uniref:pseudaminic acid biosynthesis-associated methylase n=1 Tax=Polynucleobacter paneuropaeus TaxID=2527775 RepID=UPI001BFEDE19|nr:pseudaminic acid biosynthesis-associated methylase [Polynucleobacter paneuropaeus]MBT8621877.1 pseudaminic acid biosynthesis-associated methylase [Polynucleobacter paneuropaeus]
MATKFSTEQEEFWAGEFGVEYIERNKSNQLLASNLQFFSKALNHIGAIKSCIEFGANVGMNLKALKLLFPGIDLHAVEINPQAALELEKVIESENVYAGSIFSYDPKVSVDLSMIKGVLIHINPEMLPVVYEKLYKSSSKFILLGEYYNPSPVAIPYRGHSDRLFKRDFAGEMLDLYPDLSLVDYGFSYRRDPVFPQDDITWFLLKKR